jgi:hypothetical protein
MAKPTASQGKRAARPSWADITDSFTRSKTDFQHKQERDALSVQAPDRPEQLLDKPRSEAA